MNSKAPKQDSLDLVSLSPASSEVLQVRIVDQVKVPEPAPQTKEYEPEGITYEDPSELLAREKFKAVLSVYCTKNNVFWVLTDVTKKNLLYKKTGGMECKRGTDKNSQKVASKNLQQLIHVIASLKIDLLFLHMRSGVANKKNNLTNRSVQKLLNTLKVKDCKIYSSITNSTRVAVSKIRLKGGRRGRRV